LVENFASPKTCTFRTVPSEALRPAIFVARQRSAVVKITRLIKKKKEKPDVKHSSLPAGICQWAAAIKQYKDLQGISVKVLQQKIYRDERHQSGWSQGKNFDV